MRCCIHTLTSLIVTFAVGWCSMAAAEEPGARLGRPTDPESVAILLNLLARHAENPADKTALDRQLDQAAKGVPESRKAAEEIVKSYRAIPSAERQRAFGRWAEISSRALPEEQYIKAIKQLVAGDRQSGTVLQAELKESPLDASKLSPKDRNSEQPENGDAVVEPISPRSTSKERSSVIALDYTGLHCRKETTWDQGTWSDEIYIVTAVVTYPNRTLTVQKHPWNRNYYTGVDSGDTRRGPEYACWTGSPNELCLICVVMEQDDRDNRSHVRYAQIVRSIVAFCTALELYGAGPVERTAPALLRQILEPLESLPNQDDLIAAVGYRLPATVLTAYAARPELCSHSIPYDFFTRHRGDGADYRVYFRAHYR
jgi:hypothetical protein